MKEYKTTDQAAEAIKYLSGTLVMGKKIMIEYSVSKRQLPTPQSGTIFSAPRSSRIYISGYDVEFTTPNQLLDLFSEIGRVMSSHFIEKKGYGFIEYQTVEEAERAIARFHDFEMKNRKLVVNFATMPGSAQAPPVQSQSPTRRGYRSRSRSPGFRGNHQQSKRTRTFSPHRGRSTSPGGSRSHHSNDNNNNAHFFVPPPQLTSTTTSSSSTTTDNYRSNNNNNYSSSSKHSNGNNTSDLSPRRGRSRDRSRSESPDSKHRRQSAYPAQLLPHQQQQQQKFSSPSPNRQRNASPSTVSGTNKRSRSPSRSPSHGNKSIDIDNNNNININGHGGILDNNDSHASGINGRSRMYDSVDEYSQDNNSSLITAPESQSLSYPTEDIMMVTNSQEMAFNVQQQQQHIPLSLPQPQQQPLPQQLLLPQQMYAPTTSSSSTSTSTTSSSSTKYNNSSRSNNTSHNSGGATNLPSSTLPQDIEYELRQIKDSLMREVHSVFDELKSQRTKSNIQSDRIKSELVDFRNYVATKNDNVVRKIEDTNRRLGDNTFEQFKDLQKVMSNMQMELNYLKVDITNNRADIKECNATIDKIIQETKTLVRSTKGLATNAHVTNLLADVKKTIDSNNNADSMAFGGSMMKKLYPIDALSKKLFSVEDKLEAMEKDICKHITDLQNEVLSKNAIQEMMIQEEKKRPTRKK
ncbi:hypothetical protein SAMD00019534_042780 [Acytostelium subglobosum LB1]|uniref:hypothetical protein n=1 Tax=Acytostelium subglobosum LB1 TaxID=1410327 RepID=UPI0006450287|nr:hypothetical protein SAMD00019534_042780 [Acytostelium subglobosum LB1]GAM21103.1 hypothetical protein SAMD00019534_042780 [Acytostelium subglobosum LB1]|eukprot:XP_012756237.1 hypothetical protein SAMD00019534_042780 [Acytostelium subglobosum LB1]